MAMRFSIEDVNLLAHLLSDDAPANLEWYDRRLLTEGLDRLAHGFLSAPHLEVEFRRKIHEYERGALPAGSGEASIDFMLRDIKAYLATRQWTALIIPSGQGGELDRELCSWGFIKELVDLRPDAPGLILQVEEAPGSFFSLLEVFPAFSTALSKATKWPGVLLWTRGGESAFFPLDVSSHARLKETARWIFSHLATAPYADVKLLLAQFYREFPQLESSRNSNVTFVHLSDVHLGSREANSRIPRLQQLLRNVVGEVRDDSRVVLLLSGDILDTPSDDNVDRLRAFMDFLSALSTDEPLVVLGNHDVRNDGYLAENFKFALRLPGASYRVEWLSDCGVGVICLNSVIKGRLARGYIGDEQFSDLGSAIDRKRGWQDYALFALLHHHPVPVERPHWYARPFYERVIGSRFEKTEALEDADHFLRFIEKRNVRAVFHGHKHIPRIVTAFESEHGIPVFGCGSSVGKVMTTDKDTFMSINVYNYDASKNQLSGRLLAERMPGEGLSEITRHEVVYRTSLRGPAPVH